MIKSGILPSTERLREGLEACHQSRECAQMIDAIVRCIADVFRLQEAQGVETSPELGELLHAAESGRPLRGR
jgi:hypothetical protein